ncbi:hypothetical protein [Bordetella bronchiseptica]|uniref:hypothetical protein n=1 Tax=Bordetella bronchiseptica TaxID=518 RepID=UPI0012D2F729|nr:hypothetical protein [Bordetella bronchiseptica]
MVNALLAARLGHAVEHSHAKTSTLASICPRTVLDTGGMPGYPDVDACPMARAVIRARLVEQATLAFHVSEPRAAISKNQDSRAAQAPEEKTAAIAGGCGRTCTCGRIQGTTRA